MYARLRYTFTSGEDIEIELGSDRPAYPDESRELVARLLDLWRAVVAE